MILITGAYGQLGQDFQRLLKERGQDFLAEGKETLDIRNLKALRSYVKDKDITCIINCAAYNNVDKAEEEPKLCYAINYEGAKNLAILAKEIGADYLSFSTDFVFDGKKKEAYKEEDLPHPLSVYGQSKYEGEKAIFAVKKDSFVIRCSWLYGMGNKNFTKQILAWSKEKEELVIVDDQVSSPTYTKDLAYYSLALLARKKYGLYHFSNAGEASKYEQAKYILEAISWKGRLKRAKTKDFAVKAKRAPYTKLDSKNLEAVLGEEIPTWEDALSRFLEEWKQEEKK